MRALLFTGVLITLTGCTANILSDALPGSGAKLLPAEEMEEVIEAGSGSTYLGKLSTGGAVNSRRSFIADYHGEVSITVYDNRLIDCRFWTEGRITDEMIFEGPNGFIEAFSTLCAGRLQKDGSFEFQGAYLFDAPDSMASGNTVDINEKEEQTFTMKGRIQDDEIIGDLIIGGLFRNDIVLADPSTIIDTGEGIRFTAALLP